MTKKIIALLISTAIMASLSGCAANYGAGSAEPMPISIEVQAGDSDAAERTYEAGSRLSVFSTNFSTGKKNRTHNIKKATEALNGTVVAPGEVFSYNETIGPTSRSKGYRLATIFVSGEETKGYGGGVCQVSSTLFNAADMAGMEIIERHSHSKDVQYVEEGRDAATSYRSKLDFKFGNCLDVPVIIGAHVEEGTLTVEIFEAL